MDYQPYLGNSSVLFYLTIMFLFISPSIIDIESFFFLWPYPINFPKSVRITTSTNPLQTLKSNIRSNFILCDSRYSKFSLSILSPYDKFSGPIPCLVGYLCTHSLIICNMLLHVLQKCYKCWVTATIYSSLCNLCFPSVCIICVIVSSQIL